MIEYWDFFNSGYESPPSGMGMATTLPVENDRDLVKELHDAVESVTAEKVKPIEKARMGFL
jgi:hypothetical protein